MEIEEKNPKNFPKWRNSQVISGIYNYFECIRSSPPCGQGCINFVLRARRILCGGLEQSFLPTKEVRRF